MSRKADVAKGRQELARVFRLAIRAEQNSQLMYQHALDSCGDEECRTLLASLRDDEARHEKELQSMYDELTEVLDLSRDAMDSTRRKAAARTKAATTAAAKTATKTGTKTKARTKARPKVGTRARSKSRAS